MIRIKRRQKCPEIKNQQRQNKILIETDELKNKFEESQVDYERRTKTLSFDSKIYAHESIKNILKTSQFGKCAFCESNITHISHGDVEHFRPKKGYCQNNNDELHGPGYYWLAYDFENLMLACQVCNQREKKNLFPLRNPEKRKISHNDANSLKKEKPFFINPLNEEPSFFIKFHGAQAVGIDKNHRGKKTIENIGLNRKGKNGISDLFEMRLDYLKKVQYTYFIANCNVSTQISREKIDEAKALMQQYRSPKSQYSAMIRDNFLEL
ncbi:HNH endonuclease family protein [Tenacibaculum xiamenense]|uniref:hypothetical protein n=1 Tax=Tenacibaculum xiamenense TaxID=1261553 RepID=UPI00389302CC